MELSAGNKPINAIDLDGAEDQKVAKTGGQEPVNNTSTNTDTSGGASKDSGGASNGVNAPVTGDHANGVIHGDGNKKFDTYDVADDDTVYSIAKKYGDPTKSTAENVELIKKANNLGSDYKILKGQKLTIPQPSRVIQQYEHDEPGNSSIDVNNPIQSIDFSDKPDHSHPEYESYKYNNPLEEWGGPFEAASILIEVKVKMDKGIITFKKEYKETGDGVITSQESEAEYSLNLNDLISGKNPEITLGAFMKFKVKGDFWYNSSLVVTGGVKYGILKASIDSNGILKLGIEISLSNGEKKMERVFEGKVEQKVPLKK